MTRARVTGQRIDPAQVAAAVAGLAHGATVVFIGTVRDHASGRTVTGLDYTAYEAMAREELQRILDETEAQFPGAVVAASHRIGALDPGDVSVAVAAASAHRGLAFDAARHAIEETKLRVPIWKRERYADGGVEWVTAPGAESPV
jgi:molybdopterin synthase catalytic subunit